MTNSTNKAKGINRNIEKNTEEAIAMPEARNSEHSVGKIKSIAEQSIIGIGILQDNEFKYVNEQAAKLIGYTLAEIENWTFNDLLNIVHPEDKMLIFDQLQKLQSEEKGKIVKFQTRGIKKNGEMLWTEFSLKKIDYEGKPAMLIMYLDISDMKKAEHNLKKSELKYRNAYDTLNFYKDLFVHDMNNILHNILASTEIYSLYKDKPEKKENLEDLIELIKEQTKRGSKLISNVRKLSQLEDPAISFKKIEVIEILNDALEFLHKSFQSRGINITIKARLQEYFAKANELLLDVFENILINSAKYNENDTVEIEIKISKDKVQRKNCVKVQFIDNGIGISDSRKGTIFQRGNRDHTGPKGMGLGLSLVKIIINSYNGHIEVKDRIEGDYSMGTNFTLYIPIAK